MNATTFTAEERRRLQLAGDTGAEARVRQIAGEASCVLTILSIDEPPRHLS